MTPILGATASSWRSSAGNYYSIASTTLTSDTSTITFSSIPTTYTHLEVRITTGTTNTTETAYMRFNSDSSSNYLGYQLYATQSGYPNITANSETSSTALFAGISWTSDSNYQGSSIVQIPNYRNTNMLKAMTSIQGGNGANQGIALFRNGAWKNTSAITDITFVLGAGSFRTDSVFALYGITES